MTLKQIKEIFDRLDIEGYKLNDDILYINIGEEERITKVHVLLIDGIYKSLFLDRVVQAINREYYSNGDCSLEIEQDSESVDVMYEGINLRHSSSYSKNNSVDEAREAAILYILEQLKEKE